MSLSCRLAVYSLVPTLARCARIHPTVWQILLEIMLVISISFFSLNAKLNQASSLINSGCLSNILNKLTTARMGTASPRS